MIRSLTIAALVLGSTGLGHAADLAALPLRGAIVDQVATPSWDGFYIAGHGGFADANIDLTKLGQNQVSYLLRDTDLLSGSDIASWTLTNPRDKRAAAYGALLGYNIQMDDAVVGVEADYSHTNLDVNSSDGLSRRLTIASTGNIYDATVLSGAKAKLTDYATLRARLGYTFGNLMPFLTAGGAVGRFQTAASTVVVGDYSNAAALPPVVDSPFGPYSASDGKKNNYKLGYTAGLGLEYMFGGGIFGRVEYQYVAFNLGKTDMHVARAALGVKF